MKIIIHAPNVHQGGGGTLLAALLLELQGTDCLAILDDRFEVSADLINSIRVIRSKPTIAGRLWAEKMLSAIAAPPDLVLCFGNLPPLFSNRAKVFIYLQNRYLLARYETNGFRFRQRIRIEIERAWLRLRLGGSSLIVQSPSMASEARRVLKCHRVETLPFVPRLDSGSAKRGIASIKYDYLYVASGEPHKNHRRLVEAWEILASEGVFPSLALTIHESQYQELAEHIKKRVVASRLNIINLGLVPASGMQALYAESGALVYPSLFESYGLPLYEAEKAGLAVIASERDYVRDVSEPVVSFDPTSVASIARAIKRHLGLREVHNPMIPRDFLDRIRYAANLSQSH
jgi:glycosyltransferase involved in cell wall biosynthesis